MPTCTRCGSSQTTRFTPERLGRAGVFLCLSCSKVNVLLARRVGRLRPAQRGGERPVLAAS